MKKLLLAGIFFVATSCCVSTKITSNKAPDCSDKIAKLYILVKESDNAKAFMYPFTKEMEKALAEKSVVFQDYFMDPLSLESEEDIDNKIKQYNPNFLMIISQTEARITHTSSSNSGFNGFSSGGSVGRKITGGTFDIKIFKPGSKNPIWRGNLRADGQFGIKTATVKASQKLIEKLIEDQLLNQ